MSAVGGRTTPDFLFKIILVGDTAVGKSCLLTRFIEPEEPMLGAHDATIGVEFMSKVINHDGKKIKLEIWDTAGQEAYQSITRSYFRGAHGAIVCYDITRRETFEKAMDKWYPDIKHFAQDNVVIALGGNKKDLEEKRKVATTDGESSAETNGILFQETSSKSGENVESLFLSLVEKIYEQVKIGRMEASQKKKKTTNIKTVTARDETQKNADFCC